MSTGNIYEYKRTGIIISKLDRKNSSLQDDRKHSCVQVKQETIMQFKIKCRDFSKTRTSYTVWSAAKSKWRRQSTHKWDLFSVKKSAIRSNSCVVGHRMGAPRPCRVNQCPWIRQRERRTLLAICRPCTAKLALWHFAAHKLFMKQLYGQHIKQYHAKELNKLM